MKRKTEWNINYWKLKINNYFYQKFKYMVFQATKYNRVVLSKFLENLTPEQLYFIPKGFKNNILWNLAHILVTEQMLTYGLSGLELPIDKKFVKMYAKGTFPKTEVSINDIDDVKKQLMNAIEQTKIDYEKGAFKTYNTYETSVGITLSNIEEALKFNLFHEGIHLGVILSIKKLLK